MIQVYKILHGIDNTDKNKLFTISTYTATRGHSLKLSSEDIVHAHSLNSFKTRLNHFWHDRPSKFNPSCYAPGPTARETRTYNQNASVEADRPV